LRVVETAYSVEKFVAAMSQIPVIARGPKPSAALRELNIPIAAIVPEPNTWRELLQLLDQQSAALPIHNRRVALQEYGVANMELIAALEARGAIVVAVPVYEWQLPENTGPLREAVATILRGEVDVFLITAAVQIRHLFEVAESMGLGANLVTALAATFIASIGPVTSEELVRRGLSADLEPSHPKMGILVKEAAEQASVLVLKKKNQKKKN
jgi:uroporphyrinogen-III synthase